MRETQRNPFPFGTLWYLVGSLLLILAATLIAYWPALKGPFLFDDLYLPYSYTTAGDWVLSSWLTNVRPVLMFSYWVNYHTSGVSPFAYHALNVVLHLFVSVLVFLIVFKIQEWAGTEHKLRVGLSVFAAGLFLLHPIQSEAVAYIAGRSESLSVLFAYAAFVVFLYGRSRRISAIRTISIVLLFGLAFLAKEHVVVLPFLFILTDLYWNKRGAAKSLKSHRALYAIILMAAAFASLFIIRHVLSGTQSAGFHLANLSWEQYAFTEWRAIWVYLQLFFLPLAQSADYDFAISRTPFDHGAVIALAGLLAAVVICVWARDRYKVASYGFFAFLLLLAPTSSFFPIADPLVERRLYLPSLGLLLVITELLRRSLPNRAVLAGTMTAILLLSAFLSHRRNELWGSPLALWSDTARKSPNKFRPHFQLAYACVHAGNCQRAVEEYETAARLGSRDYRLLVDWALAYDCAGQPEAAIARLVEAAKLNGTAHVYSQIGFVYARQGKRSDALAAFDKAERIDPSFESTYVYRGILYTQTLDFIDAEADFQRALALNPNNPAAKSGLEYLTKERSAGVHP